MDSHTSTSSFDIGLEIITYDDAIRHTGLYLGSAIREAIEAEVSRLKAENKRLKQENNLLRKQTREAIEEIEEIEEILDWPLKQLRRDPGIDSIGSDREDKKRAGG